MKKRNLLFFWYEKDNQISIKKILPFWKYTFLLILFVFLAYAIWYNALFVEEVNVFNFFSNLMKLFLLQNTNSKSNSLFVDSFRNLSIVFIYCISGTTIGFFLGFWSAFFTTNSWNKKWLSKIMNIFFIILRSLPFIFFAHFFTINFDGFLATLIFVTWVSFIQFHKTLAYEFDSMNLTIYNNFKKNNESKIFLLRKGVIPLLRTSFFKIFLQRLDSNIRFTGFLASFSIIHITTLISQDIKLNKFESIGIPFFIFLISMILFDRLIVNLIRKMRYDSKGVTWENINKTLLKIKLIQKSIMLVSLLITFISLIYVFSDLNSTFIGSDEKIFNIFKTETDKFFLNFNFVTLFQIFSQIYIILFFSIFLGLIFGILQNRTIFKQRKFVFITKTLIYFVKIMPTILMFYLWLAAFPKNPIAATTVAMILISTSTIAAFVNSSIYKIKKNLWEEIDLKVSYNLFLKISKIIVPHIWKDLKVSITWLVEDIAQAIIILGFFRYVSLTELSAPGNVYLDVKNGDSIFILVIPFWIFNFVLFSFAHLIRIKQNSLRSKSIFDKMWLKIVTVNKVKK